MIGISNNLIVEVEILIEDLEAKSKAKQMTKKSLKKNIWIYYKCSLNWENLLYGNN